MKKAITQDTPTSVSSVRDQLKKLEKVQAPKTALKTASSPVAAKRSVTTQAVPPVTNFSKTNGKVFFRDQTDGRN